VIGRAGPDEPADQAGDEVEVEAGGLGDERVAGTPIAALDGGGEVGLAGGAEPFEQVVDGDGGFGGHRRAVYDRPFSPNLSRSDDSDEAEGALRPFTLIRNLRALCLAVDVIEC
jgi:hypothetical protein